MSIRFRRSVRLFPGVRLNFSQSGISTTVGVRGASLTMGPTGTFANVGLPGTGLSSRTKIAPAPIRRLPAEALGGMPDSPPPPTPERQSMLPAGAIEIRSGEVSTLTSPGLGELKRLVNEAALKRRELTAEVSTHRRSLEEASKRLAFAKRFIVRIFTQGSIATLAGTVAARQNEFDRATAELEGCFVEVDFAFDEATHGTYAALARSFEGVAACQRIWDVTSTAATNRIVERTLASHALSRTPVRFDLAVPDIVKTSQTAMRLGEASGREIYLYPAFLMMRDPTSDFALIEYEEVNLEFSQSRFIEEETVPSDAEIIGQTWKKANKDGSPDRRFANNYAIPIVAYGEITLRSRAGLHESYQFSSYARADQFSKAFASHRRALGNLARSGGAGLESGPPEAAFEPELEHVEEPDAIHGGDEPTPSLIWDWIALVLMVFAIGSGAAWTFKHRAELLAPFQPPPPLAQPAPQVVPEATHRPKRPRRVRSVKPADTTGQSPSEAAAPQVTTEPPASQTQAEAQGPPAEPKPDEAPF